MLFQQGTPDTSGYMIAGYGITFFVMGLYVASLYLRSRNLKQDMATLEEMDKPAPVPIQNQSPAKSTGARSSKPVTKRKPKK